MNNAKTGKILGISSIVVALLSPLIGLVLGITTLIMARRYELYSLGNKSCQHLHCNVTERIKNGSKSTA